MSQAILRVACILLVVVGCNSATSEQTEELLQVVDKLARAVDERVVEVEPSVRTLEGAGLQDHVEKVKADRDRLQAAADRLKELRAKVPQSRDISKELLRKIEEAVADVGEAREELDRSLAEANVEFKRKQESRKGRVVY